MWCNREEKNLHPQTRFLIIRNYLGNCSWHFSIGKSASLRVKNLFRTDGSCLMHCLTPQKGVHSLRLFIWHMISRWYRKYLNECTPFCGVRQWMTQVHDMTCQIEWSIYKENAKSPLCIGKPPSASEFSDLHVFGVYYLCSVFFISISPTRKLLTNLLFYI